MRLLPSYFFLTPFIVFVCTSFIKHGTGTALSDENARAHITTAP